MANLSEVLIFSAALVAVYLLPGPDMALIITTSAFRGTKNGLMAALGLAISRTLHVTLSALGLATLFHAHPLLFDGVRWLGAAYLMWLGWKILRAGDSDTSMPMNAAQAGLTALQRGIMTNLLNPNALMFCAFLLPQFISTQHALAPQYLLLGSILVALGLVFDVVYAFAAARIARRMSGSRSVQKVSRLVFSSVFGFAAIRLALGGN